MAKIGKKIISLFCLTIFANNPPNAVVGNFRYFCIIQKAQTIMNTFRTDNRAEWRQWLAEHFETETEVRFVSRR